MLKRFARFLLPLAVLAGLATSGCTQADGSKKLLNVSYDPTRELYKHYNQAFLKHWAKDHHEPLAVDQSHGGSGRQALKVTQGLDASVVTLALAYDVDTIAQKGLIAAGWRERLPHHSCPYTSTIVFLVRKGNPKNIHDWPDLIRRDVAVITPHPKSSGGARWNYLAAWGYALKKELGSFKKLHDAKQAEAVAKAQAKARDFVSRLYKNVPVLDAGARASTITFVEHGEGDVLIAWENEAFLSLKEHPDDGMEIIIPSVSILAEPPVAVVDKVVDEQGIRAAAEEYLKYLYSTEGQTIAAENHYRPVERKGVPAESLKEFKDLELFTVDDVFGGWEKAQPLHFNDGGVFDQIYRDAKKK
jgi:sulfate/thiosulfate transport system substrate-binding protein